MSANDGLNTDELLIGGLTLRAGIPTSRWTSSRVAAVAPVEVEIGPGVVVTVDAAEPAVVLSVAINESGNPDQLLAACEPGAPVPAVLRAPAGGEETADVELRLREPWTRKALVAAITRWMPRPLHEGALLLDRAAAHHNTGDSVGGAAYVLLASPLLEALTDDAENGLLSAAALVELKAVTAAAVQTVRGTESESEIRGYMDRIATSAGISDLDLELVLLSLQEEDIATARTLGLAIDGTPDTEFTELTDPAATTARILEWVGGVHHDLKVAITHSGDGTTAHLSAVLSEWVDERCYEVGRVSAFVADPTTATLLRTAGTQAQNGILTATLHYSAPASGQVVFGLYDADLGVCAIRLGSEAANLVEIDRILLDAWSIQREALVTQSRLGGEQDGNPAEVRRRVVDLLTRAQDRVSDARAKLSRLHRKSTPTRAAELAARITAIDGYAATLQTSGANPQAGHGPLLAELLPLDPAPR